MRRKGSLAAGAIRLNLVPHIDRPTIEKSLERPPDRLNILVREGDVGMGEIDPVAHALGEVFPFRFILPDGLPALLVEFRHAKFENVILMLESQRFLDLDLDGQTVRVPAGLPVDPVAAHGLVPADEVLEGPADDMMNSRLAVRGRRPFIKCKAGAPRAGRNALLEHLVLPPEVQDAEFELRVIDLVGELLKQRLRHLRFKSS